ncbi:MAG: GTP-binding protein, partial [Candidatus Heimdallarchaeota archaeon]|nr:GTP-binding protein [Candidatus Heimdallarchaeota archaeon]
VHCSIWDLAGQEEYHSVHPQYYRGSAGAIVVYDVNNPVTFDSIEDWVMKYSSIDRKLKGPILIIGNKIDMENPIISEQLQEEKVNALREKYRDEFPIFSGRTSAKTGTQINESFNFLVSQIINWQKQELNKRKSENKSNYDINSFIPASYILGFSDHMGPFILSKSPSGREGYSDHEFSSAIKLTSVLDFEDIVSDTQVIGDAPWVEPKSNFHYVAFVIDNPEARGSKSLFMMGFCASRDIKDLVAQSKDILDGYLHSSMNKFVRFLENNELELTSASSHHKLDDNQHNELESMLLELKNNIFKIIIKNIN